jgi:hypothetical protein
MGEAKLTIDSYATVVLRLVGGPADGLVFVVPQEIIRNSLVSVIPFHVINPKPGMATFGSTDTSALTETEQVFTLPACLSGPPAGVIGYVLSMSTTGHARVSVLCIDDDPSMLVLLRRQLENAGYSVLLAEDGIVGGQLA